MNILDDFSRYNTAQNVDTRGRIISGIAGSWLLRSALKSGISIGGIFKGAAGAYLVYRAATGNCPIYTALEQSEILRARNITITHETVVKRSRQDVYSFWRKLERLPEFMTHLVSVTEAKDAQSHWVAKLPGIQKTVSWNAKIIHDEPGALLSWASMQGSDIDNAGIVKFIDAGPESTKIVAEISYRAPLELVGEGVARLINPLLERIVQNDLKNFKKVIEGVSSSSLA